MFTFTALVTRVNSVLKSGLRGFLGEVYRIAIPTFAAKQAGISRLVTRSSRNVIGGLFQWRIQKFCKGGGSTRQCVSPVGIYRKCTQRTICLLQGERRLIEEKIDPIGGSRPYRPPLNAPLDCLLVLALTRCLVLE